MEAVAFLDFLSRCEQRNYIILLDCGPHMHGPAWPQAKRVVRALLPSVCQADSTGVSLTLFADSFVSKGYIRDDREAEDTLSQMAEVFAGAPHSSLAPALRCALDEHFQAPNHATSILVVTTGDIADPLNVALVVSNAIMCIKFHFEVSVSFLQVEQSATGSKFLAELPLAVRTECRWSIVDALPLKALPPGQQLEDFLARSTRVEWSSTSLLGGTVAGRISPTPSLALPPTQKAPWELRSPRRSFDSGSVAGDLPQISLAFFRALAQRLPKAYEVLLDCSEGMSLMDYNLARHVLSRALACVYELDSEGITVWIMQGGKTFGTGYITSGEQLDEVFWQHVPQGATRLSSGLLQTLNDYFADPQRQRRTSAVLAVVAAPPHDWVAAANMLVKAATNDGTRGLTVSFLNVGTGPDFTRQLVEEVNTRAGRAFADSFRLPVYSSVLPRPRSRSVIFQSPQQDVVSAFLDRMLPDALSRAAFPIQPSTLFYSHHNL